MDMWNKPLTRENISDFYFSTVSMAFPSCYGITKEPARTERVIIKSYIDIYQQRSTLKGEDVIYAFGDILLKNANEEIERYPLPDNIILAPRDLDEYTRNYMLEKIQIKIDSTGYKVQEFISTDNKKGRQSKSLSKVLSGFPVTPLLLIELVLVAILSFLIGYVAITIPYRNEPLIDSSDFYSSTDLQEKYVSMLPFYPLNARLPGQAIEVETEIVSEPISTSSFLGPVIQETTEPPVSATMG